jgi:hypothetical protein
MTLELSRRRRRPRPRRAPRPREWTVRSAPPGFVGEGEPWGPTTYQSALAHAIVELLRGRRVELVLREPTASAARHVCCGCGGLCDSGQPCPMSYNCRCRAARADGASW